MATINIENYKISYTDQFFFDTNVWLLLFGNLANYKPKDQQEYSKLFKESLQRDIPIFISSMILSEFANVLLRIDFKQWKTKFSESKDFKKDFGTTLEYKNSIRNIKAHYIALPFSNSTVHLEIQRDFQMTNQVYRWNFERIHRMDGECDVRSVRLQPLQRVHAHAAHALLLSFGLFAQ